MSILLLLSGILFTIYLIIGFHVLSLDKKSITHRLFFVICLILSFIGLDAFFILSTQTKSEFLVGYRLAYREVDIIQCIINGFANKEIGDVL